MPVTSRLGRPLLGAVFVTGGFDALCNPGPRVAQADDIAGAVARPVGLPDDTALLVRLNAAVQVGAGVLIGLGRFPRVAALLLAGSLIPTTLAGHRYWEIEDAQERAGQRIHFMKNMAMLGGLLLAAGDTEGRPSISWRSRRALHRASVRAGELLPNG